MREPVVNPEQKTIAPVVTRGAFVRRLLRRTLPRLSRGLLATSGGKVRDRSLFLPCAIQWSARMSLMQSIRASVTAQVSLSGARKVEVILLSLDLRRWRGWRRVVPCWSFDFH